MARRHLEISHEFGTHAVRDVGTGDRIDPADLDLPASLVERLNAWAARWDTTFDLRRPEVPKVDRWVVEELGREGARLWRAVLSVLSPQDHVVCYRHTDTLYRRPDELPDAWRF